jgi:hypothetical protein
MAHIKTTVFRNVTPCIPLKSVDISEDQIASIFRVEYAEQDTSVKAGGKPSNQLGGNFGFHRKQEENGRVGLSSHWLVVGQNEAAGLSHDHPANQWEKRTGVYEALKRGGFAGLV